MTMMMMSTKLKSKFMEPNLNKFKLMMKMIMVIFSTEMVIKANFNSTVMITLLMNKLLNLMMKVITPSAIKKC
jgi:hypothetical protein